MRTRIRILPISDLVADGDLDEIELDFPVENLDRSEPLFDDPAVLIFAHGCPIADQAPHRHIIPLAVGAGAIAYLIEQMGNCALALVLQEKFIHQFAHWRFGGVLDEFLVFSDVAERSLPVQGASFACTEIESFTRSAISARSHPAIALMMVKNSMPAGVLVSRVSWRETRIGGLSLEIGR